MGTTAASTSPGPSSGLRALVPEPRPGPREWPLPPSWASECSDKRTEESPQPQARVHMSPNLEGSLLGLQVELPMGFQLAAPGSVTQQKGPGAPPLLSLNGKQASWGSGCPPSWLRRRRPEPLSGSRHPLLATSTHLVSESCVHPEHWSLTPRSSPTSSVPPHSWGGHRSIRAPGGLQGREDWPASSSSPVGAQSQGAAAQA